MTECLFTFKNRPLSNTKDVHNQIFGPLSTIKLEGGRSITVNTGIRLASTDLKCEFEIIPIDDYRHTLMFSNNVFDDSHTSELHITITNNTDGFIRLDPEYHNIFLLKSRIIEVPEVVKQEAEIAVPEVEDSAVSEDVKDVVDHIITTIIKNINSEVVESADKPATPEVKQVKKNKPRVRKQKKRVSL